MKKAKEGDLVRACLDYLAVRGIVAWRNNTGRFNIGNRWVHSGRKGSPDIIGFLKPSGRFIGVECKSKGEKQSSDQIEFQNVLTESGGLYVLAFTLDDVHDAINTAT